MRILQSLTLLLFLILISCSKEKQRSPDLEGITSDPEIVRFEQLFYNASADSLPQLQSDFPYLFPEPNPDSVWVNKMQNADERYLFEESQKKFEDFSDQKQRLQSLFRHMKYYFPSFQEPRVITMITQVDYNNKVLYADSMLFVGLDLYLGQDHEVYADFPGYVKQTYHPEHLVVDVADAMTGPMLRPAESNSFLSRIVQQGKRLKVIELLLPEISKREIMGYTDQQWDWAEQSETDIWKYFVQNELLYSTDAELSRRFIEEAPFSKFYLEVDRDSPGRIGSWFGWRIVDAFMKNNEAGIADLIRTENEEIFRRSGYKPKKKS